MSDINTSYQKFEYFAGMNSFREFVRNIFDGLKRELNADLNEILKWLNTPINEDEAIGNGHDVECPLYEFGFPCWIKKFRDQYDIQVDSDNVTVVGHNLFIGTFVPKHIGIYDEFNVFSFLKSLRQNYDGTVKLINEILEEK